MLYVVYILQSQATGRLYIGHTSNLERRLDEHSSEQTASTRGRGPWHLIYQRSFPSRSHAMKYESMLKHWKSPTRVLEHVARR